MREEEIFDVESKEDSASLDAIGFSRWEKLEGWLGIEVLSMLILLEYKSKVLLDPMILFDEGFEWRFGVEWKDGSDEVLSWNTLEVV